MLDVGTLRGISMSKYIDDNASVTSKSCKTNESAQKKNGSHDNLNMIGNK